jgi:universal stress protein E
MSILIASDLSFRTANALRRGMRIARDLSLQAEVVHVVDADLPAELRDKTVAWAKAALTRDAEAEARTLSVSTPTVTVVGGTPKRDIALHAYSIGATLLVVGTHNPDKEGFLGFGLTTVGAITRSSHIPVLLVTNDAAASYRDVVIGVDFSIYSTSAVRNAIRLFPGATLHLVHAYQVPFKMRLGTEEYLREIEQMSRASLQSYVKQEIGVLMERSATSGHGADLKPHLIEGMPRDVLRSARARLHAEPIVIGTHGSSGMVRAIWGSVAQDLLDRPPCDVLVVHDH